MLTVRRAVQQLQQMMFPRGSVQVRFVAAAVGCEWNENGAAVGQAFDLALQDAEFRRVDEIVGPIQRQQGRTNLVEVRSGVVIPGSLDLE